MADFYVGEYGSPPLEVTMPFDPTGYTTVRVEIRRPGATGFISAPVTSMTSTYVRYTMTSGDLSIAGRYGGQVTCVSATAKRIAKFSFTVDEV